MKKFAKYVHMDLFYVLVYSGPFDMHIEKIQKSTKKTLNGGGVGMSFTEIKVYNIKMAQNDLVFVRF